MVSLGTGRIPVTAVQSVNVFRPEGILDVKRLVNGFTALVNMMVDQVCIVWECTLYLPTIPIRKIFTKESLNNHLAPQTIEYKKDHYI